MNGFFGRLGAALLGLVLVTGCGGPSVQPPAPVEPNPGSVTESVLAERLATAIRFPTISLKGEPEHNRETFDGFRAWLAATFPLSFSQLSPVDLGHGTLWFTLEGSDPALEPIVFIAHQDVVPVEAGTEAGWTHPPFAGIIANGRVWGRGAIDMKGHLITLMTAMETLLEEGFRPTRTIHIGLGHDEEVDGAGARSMASWLDARGVRAWFVLDEGGTVIREMPQTGGPVALVAVGEKGFLTVEVTARARGGHSSAPPPQTAVGLLSQAIIQIEDSPFEHSLRGGPTGEMLAALAPHMHGLQGFAAAHQGLFGGLIEGALMEDDTSRAMLGTTIAPTVIRGGSVENVLPQQASALINLRLHPRDSAEDALAHLRAAVANLDGITIEPYSSWSSAPPIAPTSGPAWDIIAGAARSHAPENTPVAPSLLMATTDVRAFAGVADQLYRYSPAIIDIEDVTRIHGTDERMATANLPVMVSYFRTVMSEAGQHRE